jgi:lipopolysaccharide export LptBFGC system permease protein LptF
VLAFLLGSLGMAKILTPVMAGWLPTVIALMTGGFLVHKLSK